MRDEQRILLPPGVNEHSEVNAARRRFTKAGLGGSAILVTLASRPVLGATCMTPSAAGSGNLSQHKNPPTCSPNNPQYWIDNVPKKPNGKIKLDTLWPGQTTYTPGNVFHPLFTASNLFEYMDGPGTGGNSYNLYEVLSGRILDASGVDKGVIPNTNFSDPGSIGPWFVAGLLNAAAGFYGGVLQAIGPDPSVRGIEDEYARNGYFAPSAGKKWFADTIKAYLNDPGSVL